MSEFSDRPLVAGSVIGLRSFRVDSLGRLTGHTHRAVFTPGENVGECRKDEAYASGGIIHGSFTGSMFGSDPWLTRIYPSPRYIVGASGSFDDDAIGVKDITRPAPVKPEHKVGQIDCGCGYYAYFDGQNDYQRNSEGHLAGLIEGYGTVTLGERGFRAQKARLVALVIPTNADPRHAVRFARVRHNYADVPVFSKVKHAVAEFPLTPPEPLSPDNCDDFWTRKAAR